MTLKGQGHDPSVLKAQYLENSWQWLITRQSAMRQYGRLSYNDSQNVEVI